MSNISEKAIKNMEAMMKQSKINAGSNTDEQALQVAALYPEWASLKDGSTLEEGQRVNHNTVLYNVIQTHKKQADWAPDVAVSLFAKVLTSENLDEILPWEQPESTNPYRYGDKVTHVGKTWESHHEANTWEPGTVGTETVWIEVLA